MSSQLFVLWEVKICERKGYRYKTRDDCQYQQGNQKLLRHLHDYNTLSRTNIRTHERANARTRERTNARTHERMNVQTYDRTNLATYEHTYANGRTYQPYSQYTNYKRRFYCLTCRTTTYLNLYASIVSITYSIRLHVCVTSVIVVLATGWKVFLLFSGKAYWNNARNRDGIRSSR